MVGVGMGGSRIAPGADVRDVITWSMDRRTPWSAWNAVVHDWLMTPGAQGNPARVTSALAGSEREVALDRMPVTAARSLDHGTRREARSRWALTVDGGDGDLDEFELHSTWFALAYVGALADWPEPPR